MLNLLVGLIFECVGLLRIAAGVLTLRGVGPFTTLRGGMDMADGEQRVFGAIFIAVGVALAVAGVALGLG